MNGPTYTVLPREVMRAMPADWQQRMTACLDELAVVESTAVDDAIAAHYDRTVQDADDELPVYIAGEELDGIGLTYVEVHTALGRVRLTAEEAEQLGARLIAAAGYAHVIETEDLS
ncbi:hypothetical protein [Streptomyces sp. NPDC054784]